MVEDGGMRGDKRGHTRQIWFHPICPGAHCSYGSRMSRYRGTTEPRYSLSACPKRFACYTRVDDVSSIL